MLEVVRGIKLALDRQSA